MVERSAGITDQQIYEMIMQSQYWPPDQMRHFQRSQVAQLLRHAKANVPFYKTRLDCMFRSDGSIDWGRWAEIPILKREDLQISRKQMLATKLPHGHGGVGSHKTSGSTGHRVEMTSSELMNPIASANWSRYYLAQDVPQGMRIAQLENFEDELELGLEYKEFGTHSNWEALVSIKRSLPPKRKIEILKHFNINAIIDFSNNAEIMAKENIKSNAGLKLDYVLSYGMGFTTEQRALIKESFGARCTAPYSSKEGAMMAYPCSEGLELHICSESCILEILDDNNNPCAQGQVGHITITNIFNAAQPIIRYRHGDLAAFAPPCSCGRTSPRISEIQGRSDPIFHFPDREVSLRGILLFEVTDNFGVTAFQIAQTGPIHLEMRYVSDAEATQAQKDLVIDHVRKRLHPDVIMNFRKMDDIPYNANGKQQRQVREWNRPEA